MFGYFDSSIYGIFNEWLDTLDKHALICSDTLDTTPRVVPKINPTSNALDALDIFRDGSAGVSRAVDMAAIGATGAGERERLLHNWIPLMRDPKSRNYLHYGERIDGDRHSQVMW